MISVLGLNHKTAPLSIREKVAFPSGRVKDALLSLLNYPYVEEAVILSTCNRVEIYFYSPSSAEESVRKFLYDFHCLGENIDGYLYLYKEREAVRHLFRVVSSLDSMVIGESQILSQVKNAYFCAKEVCSAKKMLPVLFEEALKVGRRVRSETEIGKGAVSISTAAIELAKKVIGSLEGKSVLIIGAGKVGEITLRNLYERKIKAVCVANRTYTKALRLAEKFGGKVVKFNCLKDALIEADIVISSTSAPHFIIKKNMLLEVMRERILPLFLIDLGVPRNIEKVSCLVKNVYLYDIDDLVRVREQNIARRLKEVRKVNVIIEEMVRRFVETKMERCAVRG